MLSGYTNLVQDCVNPAVPLSCHFPDKIWKRVCSSMVVSTSLSAETALKQTIHLNHKYALDGCDPSSYGGILWCFGQFDGPKGTNFSPLIAAS